MMAHTLSEKEHSKEMECVKTAPKVASVASTPLFSRHSTRLWIAVLLCSCIAVQNLMRNTLAMSVVCMLNTTWLAQTQHMEAFLDDKSLLEELRVNSTEDVVVQSHCHFKSREQKRDYQGTVEWTTQQQSALFSIVFWTALFTGIPAGWLADRYGPKMLLLLSTLLHIVPTLLQPIFAVHFHHIFSVVLRGILGLGYGLMLSCVNALIAKWFPGTEKSTVVAIVTTGNQIGPVLAYPLGSLFCPLRDIMGGWPLTFYITGVCGIVWCILWCIFVTNSPLKHKKISDQERAYLAAELNAYHYKTRKTATNEIPWRKLLTSPAVYANMAMNLSSAMFVHTLGAYIPTYFETVLNLGLVANGLVSALPFLAQWVTKMISSIAADRLKRRQTLSNNMICRLFNSIGTFGAALGLLLVSFDDCNHYLVAILLICFATSCSSFYAAGFQTSLVTIAPAYTGIVSSCTRITAAIGAISGPLVVGAVTTHGSQEEWRIVFLFMAVVLATTGAIFAIFGSGEVQPWAVPPVELNQDQAVVSQHAVNDMKQRKQAQMATKSVGESGKIVRAQPVFAVEDNGEATNRAYDGTDETDYDEVDLTTVTTDRSTVEKTRF